MNRRIEERLAGSTFRTSVPSVVLVCCASGLARAAGNPDTPAKPPAKDSQETVGWHGRNRAVLPVSQTITPMGRQIEMPGMRPQALVLSPDGRILVVTGKTNELVVVNPDTAEVIDRVALPIAGAAPNSPVSPRQLEAAAKSQVSFTGLIFSGDGRRIYLSNVEGDIKVFEVDNKGRVKGLRSIPLPEAKGLQRKAEIPSGLALSPDGKRLYVCGNLTNTLLEIDTESGDVVRRFDTGVAPYDVVLVRGKAYVSNWGGRRPARDDLTGPAGRGTLARVDPVHYVASDGSVTVVDLASGKQEEIPTRLHASALAVSPDGAFVVCANAASDNLSVIETSTDRVVETIWAKPKPSELVGATPNALAFAPDGRTLYVANGTQNAIGVIAFAPGERRSRLVGLFPVGWFPAAIALDTLRRQLCVANLKGFSVSPTPLKEPPYIGAEGYNSRQWHGSVSLVPLPANDALAGHSQAVWNNLRRPAIEAAQLPPRKAQPPRAVPERIGEPSPIKHIVYIIKENRTYDQVLGDVARGNGNPRLCIFGEKITPNQHKLVADFVLLDNTYCAGILSADGHQWSTSAFATDYMEKLFAGFPRSYPDVMGRDSADALAYSPAGFIWDRVLARGLLLRDYGEFMGPRVRWRDAGRQGEPDFLACYRTWQGKSNEVTFECEPLIPSLRSHAPTDYVGWSMNVPDQYRADVILRDLRRFEQEGRFPALTIVCLPDDHTSGTKAHYPTPAAQVADNDLAFGRLVEGFSHSRFWKEMAILAIEDDPQNGWDHVSGYRTTAYVVSPYARRRAVVSTQYNTVCLLRTIEQILGLAPMNQFDAAAPPMRDCFTETPDFAPYECLPNSVPLDQMNPTPQAIADPQQRADAIASAKMNFDEVDRAPEDELNRILWRAMRGSAEPYPAWAVDTVGDDDD
ncbi:MAG: phosphoesterase [Phycisphaerae bacterium]|nr:phosphoesterase [Phycisphaerae bacterium]